MKLIVKKNYDEMSKICAQMIADKVKNNPNIVLGLATGSTPIGTYKELIKIYNEDNLDFSRVTTFNLDEYIGLSKENPNSYYHFMMENLFKWINIDINNVNIPNGIADDLEKEVKEYEEKLVKSGGVDIQLLGIGGNGHIAFNEPAEYLNTKTSIVELTEETIRANSRFFNSLEEVPKKAISMGIGSILRSREIILLASGKSKSKALFEFLTNDKVTTFLPVSFLHLHSNVVVICDEDAYSLVKEEL
jgi:glucosamine-6-phosphate deaminase